MIPLTCITPWRLNGPRTIREATADPNRCHAGPKRAASRPTAPTAEINLAGRLAGNAVSGSTRRRLSFYVLDELDVRRGRTLRALLGLVGDLRALGKRAKAASRDR